MSTPKPNIMTGTTTRAVQKPMLSSARSTAEMTAPSM